MTYFSQSWLVDTMNRRTSESIRDVPRVYYDYYVVWPLLYTYDDYDCYDYDYYHHYYWHLSRIPVCTCQNFS